MNTVAKQTMGLILVIIIGKILGFLKEIILATYYGTSMYSDAYIIALNIPMVLFTVIGTALTTTFIPIFYDIKNKSNEENTLIYTNNVLNIVIIVSIILSIVGFNFSEQLVKIFAIGFDGEVLKIANDFTKVLIWSMVFVGASNIMTSFLQANNKFIIPGSIAIYSNIIMIIFIIISYKAEYKLLPYGALLGMLIQFIVQIPYAYKLNYKYRIYLNIYDKNIKKMIWLVAPVLIGVSVNQVSTMIDRTIASTLGSGVIASLNYANKLNMFIMALFITSIGTVLYPMLSKFSSQQDKYNFIQAIVKSINIVSILIIPISVGAIVLSNPIVKLLFQRGEFDIRSTQMTSIALVFYSIGMIGFGLRDILGKVFYSLQDTKTPMISGIIAITINIVLNLILVKFMGYAGLALATSLSSIVSIVLLFNSLKKKIGYFGQDKIFKTSIKSFISAAVMGVATYFIYNILSNILGVGFIKEAIELFVSIGVGALVYSVLVIVLKIEEVSMLVDMVKNKILVKDKNIE